MAKRTTKQVKLAEQTLWQAFWTGFMWPLKSIWRGLVWLSHHFPLKHIGHILRWFGRLRVVKFIGRALGLRYLRDSWQELRGVSWPTLTEGRRLTTAVVLFSVVFGLLIAAIDFGLDKAFRQILLK